jgi:hypothetical protein
MLNFIGIIYLKCQNDQLLDLLHPLIQGGGFWNVFVFIVNIQLICHFFGGFNPNIHQ